MIWWTGLAPWEFEFPLPSSSLLLSSLDLSDTQSLRALNTSPPRNRCKFCEVVVLKFRFPPGEDVRVPDEWERGEPRGAKYVDARGQEVRQPGAPPRPPFQMSTFKLIFDMST